MLHATKASLASIESLVIPIVGRAETYTSRLVEPTINMMLRPLIASTVGIAMLAASFAVHAQTHVYRLTEIGRPHAHSINNSGQVTGWGKLSSLDHAFLWNGDDANFFIPVQVPQEDCGGGEEPRQNSRGLEVNNAGHVTGFLGFDDDPTCVTHDVNYAFNWDGMTLQLLRSLTGNNEDHIAGNGINDVGHLTGESETANGEIHAFLWNGTVMRDLGTLGGDFSSGVGINKQGKIVGTSTLAAPPGQEGLRRAFLWDGAKMVNLGTLGGSESTGSSINAKGQITGTSLTANDEEGHAFLWQSGLMMDIGTLNGFGTEGVAINNAGQIVGHSSAADGNRVGFLWASGTIQELNSLVPSSDPLKPFVTIEQVFDINNLGQIVAWGWNDRLGARRSYLLSPSYKLTNFLSPTASSVRRNTSVRIAIGLLDAANVRVPDSRAALLAADPCRVQVSVKGAQSLTRACMTYNAVANEYSFNWNVRPTTGSATIEVRVNYGSPGPLKVIKTKTITITT